jgi:hypothetical protein
MVNPVHIGRYDKAPKDSVNGHGNMDVAVIEQGGDARISQMATRKKIPKKNPKRIVISLLIK